MFLYQCALRQSQMCREISQQRTTLVTILYTTSNACLKYDQCCDRKSRAACAQSFALWQQATIEIMFAISITTACSCYIYYGVILHAHPVRGESHNQRNTTGEVATPASLFLVYSRYSGVPENVVAKCVVAQKRTLRTTRLACHAINQIVKKMQKQTGCKTETAVQVVK